MIRILEEKQRGPTFYLGIHPREVDRAYWKVARRALSLQTVRQTFGFVLVIEGKVFSIGLGGHRCHLRGAQTPLKILKSLVSGFQVTKSLVPAAFTQLIDTVAYFALWVLLRKALYARTAAFILRQQSTHIVRKLPGMVNHRRGLP